MASWLDELKAASFGGVEFHVFSVQWDAGDSVVVREYPFEDVPSAFRMGAIGERLRFSAYVIGKDYRSKRDALKAVLTGERVLVHPTAGSMRATALQYRTEERPVTEGGIVKFELEFVLAGPQSYPTSTANTQGLAAEAAAQAKAAAVQQFAAEFSLAGAPAWVQERVVDHVTGMVGGVWDKIKGAASGLGDFTDAITGSYQVLRGGLVDLVHAPAGLAGAVRELFNLPSVMSSATSGSFRSVYQSLFGLGSNVRKADFEYSVQAGPGQLAMAGLGQPEALGADTGARRTQARLDGAVDRLFDTLAVATWVETVADADLPGYEEVQAWRELLHTQCVTLLEAASTDQAPAELPTMNWHDAILELMTAGLEDLQTRGRDQARLSSFTPGSTTNIWSLSFDLYGTADWADELMEMNPHITHPMLVPAGKPLKVVRHD